jgi:tetratricopeptide (TPR) repeat protein
MAAIGPAAPTSRAVEVKSFDEAETRSAETGKPILLEFYREDCEYCEDATRAFESDENIQAALDKVVYLKLNPLIGEGTPLSETYRVGIYYPVFILTNSEGHAIARWTGFTGTERFVGSFDQALSDLATVEERVSRCKIGPTVKDVLFLANFYNDAREYLKARDYYRELRRLQGPQLDLSYRLFQITAEAVWNDLLPFDSLIAAADEVLAKREENSRNLGQMAQIMANVARRTGHTDRIEPYLMAGIEATSRRTDETGIDLRRDLLADYALHALNDTAEALSVKKKALGERWESDPERYFRFGEWCYQRNINLAAAEEYVRRATEKASGDKFQATHLRLLAEICYARGKVDEAIELANQALALDPTAFWFEEKLAEWRAKQGRTE